MNVPPPGPEQPKPEPEVPLREESIKQALDFLRRPEASVLTKPQQEEFLSKKLTQPEIDELRRRQTAEEQKQQQQEQASLPRTVATPAPAEPATGYPQQYQQPYAQSPAQYQQPQYQRAQPWPQGNGGGFQMPAAPQPYYPPGARFQATPQPPLPNYMQLQVEPEPASWLWMVGGAVIAAGATLGAVWRQSWSNEDDSPWMVQELERLAGDERPSEQDKKDGQAEAAVGGGTDSSSSPENTGTDMTTKEAFEDLVSLLRQHSEEAHENSLAFKKATTTLQEQFQSVLTAMEKFAENQEKAQRTAKQEPLELSASTIQALANILQPTGERAPVAVTVAEAVAAGAVAEPIPIATPEETTAASSGAGAREPPAAEAALGLRDQFDAINQNLQRLVQQSQAKAEASKSMQTLCLILQNVVNNPSHERHRKVNTTGSRFHELFSTKGSAAELLKLAGFVYQEPNFILPQEKSTEAALRVRDLVQSAQSNLEQMWAARGAGEGGVEGGSAVQQSQEAKAVAKPGVAENVAGASASSAAQADLPVTPAPPAAPAKPWMSNVTASQAARPAAGAAIAAADAERSEVIAAAAVEESPAASGPSLLATGQVAHNAESPSSEDPTASSQVEEDPIAASSPNQGGGGTTEPVQEIQPQCGG
mmetsp:Transcript_23233/g.51400  ORF Transcript_23233/g.51400 Transcript_23233/m.51400 type:complete len:650 (-) Transcript_23233:35-1984(-)